MFSPPYAELHTHSAYSFLDGASTPQELVAEAARLGLRAIALTDHNGLYGVVRFAEAAAELAAAGQEIATVFGAELSLAATDASSFPKSRTEHTDPPGPHLLVLARGPRRRGGKTPSSWPAGSAEPPGHSPPGHGPSRRCDEACPRAPAPFPPSSAAHCPSPRPPRYRTYVRRLSGGCEKEL
ncbi:PHP domain-containing protein [Mycolicibacter icosiumassiliensis]|uniref:PHP domain-containing protein n=1 Tax=Mycolicibacter icosiumassiliensis TaxID=1792835 RepID=UPI00082ADF3C